MSEESDPFIHQVEICNMTWFSQVGLFLNDESDKGSWVHKNNVQGIVQIVDWHALTDNDAPCLRTGFGPLIFRDDVQQWLDEKRWSYKLGRTRCDWNSQCKGVIAFKEPDHAIIFKLTWGGSA